MSRKNKVKRFRALHEDGCFILPNPWDIGSAVRLAARGFKALASTSAGFAWTLGRDDGEVTRDELLAFAGLDASGIERAVRARFASVLTTPALRSAI